MKNEIQFRVLDLFIAATAAAISTVLHFNFSNWQTADYNIFMMNHRQVFSLNILFLTTATLVAFVGRASQRRFAAGYAAFGWVFLICVLRCSFVPSDNYQVWIHGKASLMGVLISILAGFVAYYLLPPVQPKSN